MGRPGFDFFENPWTDVLDGPHSDDILQNRQLFYHVGFVAMARSLYRKDPCLYSHPRADSMEPQQHPNTPDRFINQEGVKVQNGIWRQSRFCNMDTQDCTTATETMAETRTEGGGGYTSFTPNLEQPSAPFDPDLEQSDDQGPQRCST